MNEPVDIEFRVNNGELEIQSRRAVNSILGVGSAGAQAAAGVNRLAGELKSLGAGFVGISAMKQFAEQVVSMRGEIQQLGIAFETMLDSKQKADSMMQDIIRFAQKTPFTLTEVADNTKQLMAMGIASEKVMDTMRALGDVAAGVSVPISRLAINYGQVAAQGNLQQREIRDFAMAGVPIVAELATMLNKTSAEITNMVSAGDIGFSLVEQAFKNMSSEGGKFYNLMEKQNASVTGQVSKLKDQIQIMFNSIGEANEGVIYGAIDAASSLVENYEKIGKIIMELIVAYGSYKAAVIALGVAENLRYQSAMASMAGMTKMQALTAVFREKMQALNKTLLANPYVLIGAAVAALSVQIYEITERISGLNKIASVEKDIAQSVNTEYEKSAVRIEKLIGVIEDEGQAMSERNSAIERLKSILPGYNGMLNEEGRLVNHNKQEIDGYLVSLREKIELKTLESELDTLIEKRAQAQADADLARSNSKNFGRNALLAVSGPFGAWKGLKDSYSALFDSADVKAYDKAIENVGDRLVELQGKYSEASESISADGKNQLKEAIKNKEYWENIKKEAEVALGKLVPGTENWDELTKKIAAADAQLKKYDTAAKSTGDNHRVEAEAQRRLEALQWLANKQKDLDLELVRSKLDAEQKSLDIEEDSFNRQMKQNDLNYRKELLAIKEHEAAKQEAAQEAAEKIYVSEKGNNKGFDFSKFDITKLPDELKPENIEKQASVLEADAYKLLTAANRNTLKPLLDDYDSYESKRLKSAKKYTDLRLALDKQYGDNKGIEYKKTLENINRAETDEFEGLNEQYAESAEAFRNLNRVIVEEGRAALQERLKRLEIYLREVEVKAGKESEIYKAVAKDVQSAKKELTNDTIESFREVSDLMNNIVSHIGDTNDNLAKTAASIAESAINIYAAFKSDNKGSQVSGIISGILAISASIRDARYDYLAINDPLGDQEKMHQAIANSVDVTNARLERQKLLLDDMSGTDLVLGKFDLIESNAKKQEDALSKLKQTQFEYINSQKEVYKDTDWLPFRGPLEAKGLNRIGNFLSFAGQMETETLYEFKGIDTSAFKDIEDYRNLLLEIQENGGQIYGKKVVESDIETLKLLIDEYDKAIAEQKQLMKELEGVFTDTTADAISQSIADGFISGKRSMTDFAEDFQTLMSNAVKASFRINVTEQLAKDFYDKFVNATQSDFMLTADEIASLKDDFQSRIESAGEQWKQFEEILLQAGIDLSDASTQKAEKGDFRTVSQESFDLWLGQFTAIRVHTSDISSFLAEMDFQGTALISHLSAIEKNTADTVTVLKSVDGRLKKFEVEGVKVL